MNTYDIDKVSPRPWAYDDYWFEINDAGGNTALGLLDDEEGENAEYAVHCVNQHDALMAFARAVEEELQSIIPDPSIPDIRKALDALRDAGVEI